LFWSLPETGTQSNGFANAGLQMRLQEKGLGSDCRRAVVSARWYLDREKAGYPPEDCFWAIFVITGVSAAAVFAYVSPVLEGRAFFQR
jgi:hypothetical protein